MMQVEKLKKRSNGLAEKVAQCWSILLACCWKQKAAAAPVMSNNQWFKCCCYSNVLEEATCYACLRFAVGYNLSMLTRENKQTGWKSSLAEICEFAWNYCFLYGCIKSTIYPRYQRRCKKVGGTQTRALGSALLHCSTCLVFTLFLSCHPLCGAFSLLSAVILHPTL